jgi:hypothetical protein
MQITQIADPFSSSVAKSKGGIWIFLIIIGILGAIGFYLYKKNKIQLLNGKFIFNPNN